MLKYFNLDYIKLRLQEKSFNYQRVDDIYPGDIIGIIASSHGDINALNYMIEYLRGRGTKKIFHAGDIMDEHGGASECLAVTLENPDIYPVLGNHDLLILKKDYIHDYMEEYIKLANRTYNKIIEIPDLVEKILNIPVKIDTNYFSIVHESVDPPYYAKLTKKRKKNHQFGQAVDENVFAVFSGSLKHPYFIGSDHSGYIIEPENPLKLKYLKPGEILNVIGSKVISVPSISIPKDRYYNCGSILLTINNNASLTIEMINLDNITTYKRTGEIEIRNI